METACHPTLMSSADRQILVKMEHVPSDLRYSGQKSKQSNKRKTVLLPTQTALHVYTWYTCCWTIMRTASIYSTMLAENIPKAIIWLLEYMHQCFSQFVHVCLSNCNGTRKFEKKSFTVLLLILVCSS